MLFHDFEFFEGQFARFQENGVRDPDLSDVVQGGGIDPAQARTYRQDVRIFRFAARRSPTAFIIRCVRWYGCPSRRSALPEGRHCFDSHIAVKLILRSFLIFFSKQLVLLFHGFARDLKLVWRSIRLRGTAVQRLRM
jgi:hypothetical protein